MSGNAGAFDRDVVRLAVRYRPNADVLVAQATDFKKAAVQRDEPDADTTLEWVRRPDGTRNLVGLRLMFAAKRAAGGRLSPSLPDELDERLGHFVNKLSGLGDIDADPLMRTETDIEMPTAALMLPDDLSLADAMTLQPSSSPLASPMDSLVSAMSFGPPEPAGSDTSPAELAAALLDLADAIDTTDPHADPLPTSRLVNALRELASTLAASEGLTAPGASAAARLVNRGGTPLTAGERDLLADILLKLDDAEQWDEALARLEDLADRLGSEPS